MIAISFYFLHNIKVSPSLNLAVKMKERIQWIYSFFLSFFFLCSFRGSKESLQVPRLGVLLPLVLVLSWYPLYQLQAIQTLLTPSA